LHHDFLAGLQHFADELRTARAMMMPVMAMAMMLAMAAVTPATVEASASTITATTIVTTATSTAIAVSASAERPLEARTRIATYAGGLAWKFACRFVAGMRRASFAGEQQ
jgi:hypothetical protein